jgi:hypothetical protein
MSQSLGWVVPGLMLLIAPVVAQPVQSSGVLPNAEIVEAIRDGLAGKKQHHECRASVGGGAHFVATLEGPIGRIMRAARAARDHGRTFTPEDVSRDMRQRTLWVRVTGGVWEPQDVPPGLVYFEGEIPRTPPARARTPRATDIRVVGTAGNRPAIPSVSAPRRLPFALEMGFDFDAAKTLNGAIDVHIAGTAAGTCRVGARAIDHLR